jgi:MoaD family protein
VVYFVGWKVIATYRDTMTIKIHTSVLSYQYTDSKEVVEIKGESVGQCLDDLLNQFPRIKEALFDENGNLSDYVGIYINGESVYPDGLAKPVKDGDVLHIVPIISGG